MFNIDATRLLRVTASMAPWLVSGDAAIIQKMFLRITNDPRYEPDDFSQSWPARFGTHVEPLALDWYGEQKQVSFTDRQKSYVHPTRDYVSATLDARMMPGNVIVDVKCIHAFASFEDRASFYLPQLIVQQECADGEAIALLFVKGGEEPVLWRYDEVDPGYRAAVWERIDLFWQCVENLTPPVELKFKRIVPPEKWRSIDLADEEVNWADEMRSLLLDWDVTKQPAKMHDIAKTGIKALIPDDVGYIKAEKYEVVRDRRNAITIRYRKER